MIPVLIRLLLSSLLIAASAIPICVTAQNLLQNVTSIGQIPAELMAYAPNGVRPGQTLWIGLQLRHPTKWHTYWKNPGDSGLPTTFQWTLPAGVDAGDIAWPVPKKLPVADMINYGYDGTVLLPVPLTITPDFNFSSSSLNIKLHANWLACQQECIPQENDFELHLPIQSATVFDAAAFESAFLSLPQTLADKSSITVDGQHLRMVVKGLPAALQGQKLEIFSEIPEVIEPAGLGSQVWQGAVWTATVPIAIHRGTSPKALPLVIVADTAGHRSGFATVAQVSGDWPALNDTVVQPVLVPTSPGTGTFWLALFGAFLGGMVLNLMPCVFPVLAIKVLSFSRHHDDPHHQRIGALAYGAGVVLSFVALGVLMVALRSAGEQLGWGFQLQSPAVVAILAALFTVIGLNLAGVFAFGHFLPGSVAGLQVQHFTVNAFLSGMLAVVIASPCTAPFMGASLGLALGLPLWQALLIFVALGVGMALPFLALCWSPALLHWLPRSGAWMNSFRHGMAFPMFATVVWLVWVLGQQSGIHGAASLLALLLGLAFILWSLGLKGRSRWIMTTLSIVFVTLLTSVTGQNIIQPLTTVSMTNSERWQAWSPEKVQHHLAQGSPVFVDFTAAWCVTCQFNKRVLSDAAVVSDFDAKKVVLLRADWTLRDPTITAALTQLGRNGVPVYVLYAPKHSPVIFSEILTAHDLHQALASLNVQ